MTTIIIIILGLVAFAGAATFVLLGTDFGQGIIDKITGRKDTGLTDLSEADTLSTAKDVGAVAPGVARDPFSVVLGYYIDSKNAQRVRRDPEANGQLVSTEPGLPTLVFGPPGSGKTTSLLQPAILTFGQGKSPILAGSVKHDLAHATIKLRSKLGKAQIFDPTGQTPSNLKPYLAKWTPLAACRTWRGANETAAALVFASTEGGGDDKFWSSQSVSLMSVLLFITASRPGSSMQQVSELLGDLLTTTSGADKDAEDGSKPEARGFDAVQEQIREAISTRERHLEVVKADAASGKLSTSEATAKISKLEFRIDEFRAAQETVLPFVSIAQAAPPTIGGVLAGCTNVLQVYRYARDYARVAWDDEDLIDIDEFLNGSNTVYLCAPPRNLELYAPLLSAFASAVIARAYELGQSREDGRLPRGLLLAIDEYAAMPINDLPALFATARSYGLTFLVAAQDLSQIVHKNGEALARSLLSSAACIAVLSRAKDPYTIDTLSKIAGESKVQSLSYTRSTSKSKGKGEDKGKQEGTSESVTESHEFRPLLPPGKISTFDKQEAFAIVGNQRCQILLRPHYKTAILSRLAAGDVSALQEENTFHNVKTDIPAQPTENLADFSEPVEPDPYEEKRRRRRHAQTA